jgi:ABC-type polysaccharide/polyol phosphate export permease
MYASPVAYSAGLIPTGFWRIVYGLNPLAGVIQGFRWALLGGSPPDELMAVSVAMVVVLLVAGLFYFRRMEKTLPQRRGPGHEETRNRTKVFKSVIYSDCAEGGLP